MPQLTATPLPLPLPPILVGQCYLVVNNEHVAAVAVCFSPFPWILYVFFGAK